MEIQYRYTKELSFKDGSNIHLVSKMSTLTESIRMVYSMYVKDALSEVNLHIARL